MARRKARQRISYVLPLASARGGHRLGVNSLAVDSEQSILYSGGRDGVICAWDLNLSADASHSAGNGTNTNGAAPASTTTFRTQTRAHTHWVNDIALVQNKTAVVSASSDVTVKLWRPHAAEEGTKPETLGQHTDYVKCLAPAGPTASWIASGGLDRKIRLWDLAGGGETLAIDTAQEEDEQRANKAAKGSVYALTVCGSVMASGGPDSVLRVWDARSGKRITKFVGHTDNVRGILVSEGGDVLMTASSDQTIKVWSMAAGRCISTLTMHNDSVWSLYSNHPQLLVFHSSDRSGLIAKTDLRGNPASMDEGISVAVAQEHQGINQIVVDSDRVWTATASSSICRYHDVDTTAELEAPDSPRQVRLSNLVIRPRGQDGEEIPATSTSKKIPLESILKISNSVAPRLRDTEPSLSNRKVSEAIIDTDLDNSIPIHDLPEETIEGQHGLIKHVMLNDRKRVLTLDDAGEVVLWDLLKCVPIKSYGKKHLEDVLPEVNTNESVLNWCSVDTRTGSLAITLEENYAFDAEVYADETEHDGLIEFREDQRINLGKWVLRYLFANLIDEEIRRDSAHRGTLNVIPRNPAITLKSPTKLAPALQSPPRPSWLDDDSAITPRPMNGTMAITPGLAIGVASPGTAGLNVPGSTGPLSGGEDGKTNPGPGVSRTSGDYFSSIPPPQPPQPGNHKDGEHQAPAGHDNSASPATGGDDAGGGKDGGKSGLFGKKFRMNFPKKLGGAGRASSEQAAKTAAAADEKAEESDRGSEREDKVVEDNFFGVVQKIRHEYDERLAEHPNDAPESSITPSMPTETPVLRPPPATTIVIQEDSVEAGGVADLYRGTVASLGNDADLVEKAAPMWLGELLLRNTPPLKDINKLSFILLPLEELLPGIAAADGNARLNANRMLRAKKVLGYVADRVDPDVEGEDAEKKEEEKEEEKEGESAKKKLRPEEFLDLYCQGQLVPPNMTLATLRATVWKAPGDLTLYYKSNGVRPELEEYWAKHKAAKEAAEKQAEAEAAPAAEGVNAAS